MLRWQCNLIKIKKCYSIHSHILTCLQEITCTLKFTMHKIVHTPVSTLWRNDSQILWSNLSTCKIVFNSMLFQQLDFPLCIFQFLSKTDFEGTFQSINLGAFHSNTVNTGTLENSICPLNVPLSYYSCLAACSQMSRCWYQFYFYGTMRCLFSNLFSHFSHT